MKKILISLTIVGLLGASNAQGALLMKKKAVGTTVTATTAWGATAPATIEGGSTALSHYGEQVESRKSLLNLLLPRSARRGVTVPKLLYILMAVIGLGWLAIGINDSFSTWSWVIAFFLYVFFFLPGVIYSLVMMRGYYM